MGKQSFVVYDDWGVLVENMPEDGAGELFKALFEYRRTHSMPHVGADVQPVLAFMISQIDKDVERYEKTCERNREKVMKRWSAVNNGMPNDTVAYSGIHPHTENTDKDKDKDKDKDNDVHVNMESYDHMDDMDDDIAYWDRVLSEETA